MNLKTLMRRYPTEAAARPWFEETRWPDGPVCPRCGVVERASALRTRPGQYTCLECRYRYSVTSETALHNTKLPLRTWLIAMCLITTSSKGVSAMKLADWLGVSYKTAWHVGHRIRSMMAAEPILLEGVVELDETYVGGKPRKAHRERLLPKGQRPKRKRGRATDKTCVFVAVARGGRVIPSHTKGALGGAVRAVVGVFHYVSPKHLHRYAIEAAFRWNEREKDVLGNLSMLVRFSRFPLAYGTLTA